MDGLCEALSGVHGTHLAESGSTRGTLLCAWWERSGLLAWVLLGSQGVKGPTQPLPMPAHPPLKDATACPAPGVRACTV